MVQQTINLDYIPSGICPVVYATQYDHELRGIIINPINTSLTGLTASVSGTKKDGTGFFYSCAISGGKILVDVTKQMTMYAGDVLCSVVLGNGDGDTVAASFVLSVRPCGLEDDTEISESDLALLAEMPSMVAEAKDAAQRAEQAAGVSADGTTITQASDGKLSVANTVLSRTLLGMSLEGVTAYPTAVGVYRVTANKPSGLPTQASAYGVLIIYGTGYFTHTYQGYLGDLWVARTDSSVNAPSSWRQVQPCKSINTSETDLNNITDVGVWRLAVAPTANFPVYGTSASPVGSPFTYGFLTVEKYVEDSIVQTLVCTNNASYSASWAGRTYRRVKINNSTSWSDWQEIVTAQSFSTLNPSASTLDVNNITLGGICPVEISAESTHGSGANARVINFRTAGGSILQVAISASQIAVRCYLASNQTWTNWRKIGLT